MGVSYGGLSAFYIAASRSDTFHNLAAFSPSFWVLNNLEYLNDPRQKEGASQMLPALNGETTACGGTTGFACPRLPVKIFLTTGLPAWDVGDFSGLVAELKGQKYPIEFHQVREGHTWDNWRGKVLSYLEGKDVYVADVFAGAAYFAVETGVAAFAVAAVVLCTKPDMRMRDAWMASVVLALLGSLAVTAPAAAGSTLVRMVDAEFLPRVARIAIGDELLRAVGGDEQLDDDAARRPRPALAGFMGGFLGLVIAAVAIVVLTRTDNRVRDERDVERLAGRPPRSLEDALRSAKL